MEERGQVVKLKSLQHLEIVNNQKIQSFRIVKIDRRKELRTIKEIIRELICMITIIIVKQS